MPFADVALAKAKKGMISIYGLVLMIGLLYSKSIKIEQVEPTGKFLRDIMPIMFIPAGVKLITVWEAVQAEVIPIVTITVTTTLLVMVVTGRVCQHFAKNDYTQNVSHQKTAEKVNWKRQLEVIALLIAYGITYILTRNVKFSIRFFENSAFFGVVLSNVAYRIVVI